MDIERLMLKSRGLAINDSEAQPDMGRLRAYRLGRIQAEVRARDLGGLLLFDSVNIRYASAAVLNATDSHPVAPRQATPDRVRLATGRGIGRLIASGMTVLAGGAAVSLTRCRRERLGLSDLRAERRLRRSAGSA